MSQISMTEYQSNPAISGSDLVCIAQNGLNFWRWKKTQPRETTRAMEVGSAIHALLGAALLGSDPESCVQTYSEGSFRTKGFEAWRAKLGTEVVGLDRDERDLADRLVKAALECSEVRKYLDDALVEESVFGTDPETGLARKCRPDFINVKERVSINVKSALDASEAGFFRAIKDFGYDLQCVNYEDVLKLAFNGQQFSEIHVLLEKNDGGPVKIAIRTIDDDTLDNARFLSRRLLKAIAEKQEDAKPRLMTALVPGWARSSCEWLEV